MKRISNRFPKEIKLEVIEEYLNTDVSQKELMKRFNIRGRNTIKLWMRKFDLVKPNEHQIELQRIMTTQEERTPYERELEAKIKKLEEQLRYEKLRAEALNTMIDLAEKQLKISIRKKSGARQSKP